VRALVVSYNFPPVGGAGVQRVLKLVKYLPLHGVEPAILTVSNPSVPVLDPSLERDFPPGLSVTRARTFEPSYAAKRAAWAAKASANGSASAEASTGASARANLKRSVTRRLGEGARQLLFPDPQLLWQPAAQLSLATFAGLAALASRPRPDVVFISGPPFSQFLLGPTARLLFPKSALVLDYRDEWSTYRTSYEMMGSRVGRLLGDPLEEALLRASHAVTTATGEFRDALLERFAFLDPARVRAIPNGFDPDDFPTDLPEPPRDRFVVSYAGTVFRLTSVRGFLSGLRLFHERAPELARWMRVSFMGRIVETEADAFEGTAALGVDQRGYLPHEDVVRALAASHMNLCVLDDVPGAERIYPAKIFELMALGRTILTLAPEGALARLVRDQALGTVLPPRDAPAIAAELERQVGAFRARDGAPLAPSAKAIDRYSRRSLAGEFAAVFREASERAR
jgi:glycosyltransferase involved in cell wall biosynthesis